MSQNSEPARHPLFCDRCLCRLHPGDGNFYVVRIEGVADPTPPSFSQDDLAHSTSKEIDRLIRHMSGQTEQELLDQVYRRVIITLCGPCYADWIENPAGA